MSSRSKRGGRQMKFVEIVDNNDDAGLTEHQQRQQQQHGAEVTEKKIMKTIAAENSAKNNGGGGGGGGGDGATEAIGSSSNNNRKQRQQRDRPRRKKRQQQQQQQQQQTSSISYGAFSSHIHHDHQDQQQQHHSQGQSSSSSSKHSHHRVKHHKDTDYENMDVREKMEVMLQRETYECTICCEKIRRHHAIWSCRDQCGGCFHMGCIKKWARKSVANASQLRSEDFDDVDGNGQERSNWRCPLCQNLYRYVPHQYTCFCGKLRDPEYKRSSGHVPHSCGDTCGLTIKALQTNSEAGSRCPHTCTLRCHPGPCNIGAHCSLFRQEQCFCGKDSFQVPCASDMGSRSCKQECDKLLNCGKHRCRKQCHDREHDPCGPCQVRSEQRCYCGKSVEEKTCANAEDVWINDNGDQHSFSCGSICGKTLACGNHTCTKPCHMGPCEPCETSTDIVTTCPCGKVPLRVLLGNKKRTSCLDPVPCCRGKCGTLLPCGKHHCQRTCHTGSCGHCTGVSSASCRCGLTSIRMPCVLTYMNEEQLDECTDQEKQWIEELKAKHPQASPFTCNKPCRSRKNCGKHQCKELCCPLNPAGRASREMRDEEGLHICHIKCNRKLNCGIHRCDFPCHGNTPCAPCAIVIREPLTCPCGTQRLEPPFVCGQAKLPLCFEPCSLKRACGHETNHPCHPESHACVPCNVLVDKMCMGGHKEMTVPCQMKDICCGQRCGKMLPCGLHTCQKTCHNGPCESVQIQNNVESDDPTAKVDFISCGKACRAIIPKCGHRCNQPCHDGDCVTELCVHPVNIFCNCGRKSESVPCAELQSTIAISHPEACFDTDNLPPMLECDAKCKSLARKMQLAEAFGIDVVKNEMPLYDDDLIEFGRKNTSFLLLIEQELAIVASTTHASRSHTFEPMNPRKREFIHKLAEFYGLESRSLYPEPNRCVIVSHIPNAKVPSTTLSMLLREPSRMAMLQEKRKEKAEADAAYQHQQYLKLMSKREERRKQMTNFSEDMHDDGEYEGSFVFAEDQDVEQSVRQQRDYRLQQQEDQQQEGHVKQKGNFWDVLSA